MSDRSLIAKGWKQMAESSFEAGCSLAGETHDRAAISRFYYAAYQAAHGLLFARTSMMPPRRGNWDHEPLRNPVFVAIRDALRGGNDAALRAKNQLAEAFALRVRADYNPDEPPSREDVLAAQRIAQSLLGYARKFG